MLSYFLLVSNYSHELSYLGSLFSQDIELCYAFVLKLLGEEGTASTA